VPDDNNNHQPPHTDQNFGIHRNTASQWAALAQDSWAGYLAALSARS
jgi:hypothetical protein